MAALSCAVAASAQTIARRHVTSEYAGGRTIITLRWRGDESDLWLYGFHSSIKIESPKIKNFAWPRTKCQPVIT